MASWLQLPLEQRRSRLRSRQVPNAAVVLREICALPPSRQLVALVTVLLCSKVVLQQVVVVLRQVMLLLVGSATL